MSGYYMLDILLDSGDAKMSKSWVSAILVGNTDKEVIIIIV